MRSSPPPVRLVPPREPSAPDLPLLNASEVARALNIHPKRVYELNLPVVRVGERTLRWHRRDVEQFIESRTKA